MPEEIIMPKLGMTMETGTITRWYKKEGEFVKKDEPVVEIMTDKANMDVESPADGTLIKIFATEGEEKPVGAVIGLIKLPDDNDEEILKFIEKIKKSAEQSTPKNEEGILNAPETEKSHEKYIPATPLAKRLAREKGIKLNPTKGRFITAKDLGQGTKFEKLTPIMKAMAKKMEQSSKIPQFTLYYDIEAEELLKVNLSLKNKGINSTITAIIAWVTASLLKKFSLFNAYIENDNLKFKDTIEVGIATATEQGLIVPVLKNIDNLNLEAFFEKFNSLLEKARNGKLSLPELEGGSITISNLGPFGVDSFRALLVPGQSAILAVSSIKNKLVAVDNGIFIKKMMNVSISCDHRFIDGATAAKFMQSFKEMLEEKALEEVLYGHNKN